MSRPKLNENTKKHLISFKLSPELIAKLRYIKKRDQISMTSIIENSLEKVK